ncbi:aminoglycoside phosphotransferase family protein [Halostella salina]|uniref:aminoglycoside phosphotransferase family protein n=1 Tax=Halostella salina TaxID=1547897 RepID=UPI0013CEEBC3|nr:aminoglycoside phosphotransferase family protein [Halostella salina]
MSEPTQDGRAVHDALAQHFEQYEVRRLLHDVPPHETYEVTVDGRRAVCKVATDPRGDPTTEAHVISHVGRETSVPVPTVIAVGTDHFVAAWHPDAPRTATVDEATAHTMGAGVAALHDATAGAFDAPGPFGADDGTLTVDGHEDWHAALTARLADRRDYLSTVGHADVADAVVDFLRANPDALAGAGEPVLCHGDFVPAHASVNGGELACVIDFEHALCGPAEYDCWRTLLPLGIEADAAVVDRFRAGYESVRSLSAGFERREPVYRIVLTVSYLKSLYLQDRHDAGSTRERAERLREVVFDGLDELERTY